MKLNVKLAVGFMIFMMSFSSSLFAEDIEKPHEFSSGTHANAEEVNENFDVLYNKVNELAKPIIFSGGCTSHGTAVGYNKYCLDGTDFNTSQAYLSVDPSGDITVLKAGYYRVNIWAISRVPNHNGLRLIVNGGYKHWDYQLMDGNYWKTRRIDVTWPFQVGDVFYLEFENAGSVGQYAFHGWNLSGQHSRLQVTFKGSLD